VPENPVVYTSRAVVPGDDAFLLRLYATTHTDLDSIDLPQAQKDLIVRMQFEAQRRQYAFAYPKAEHNLILINNEPVGRMLIDRSGAEYRLIDIALLPDVRGQGLGTQLVERLLSDARVSNAKVGLQVRKNNPALQLYRRLGFSVCQDKGVDLVMQWTPEKT
jgi:GNAT superfamily N-acetyltransferase